jgi:hypothetical protein
MFWKGSVWGFHDQCAAEILFDHPGDRARIWLSRVVKQAPLTEIGARLRQVEQEVGQPFPGLLQQGDDAVVVAAEPSQHLSHGRSPSWVHIEHVVQQGPQRRRHRRGGSNLDPDLLLELESDERIKETLHILQRRSVPSVVVATETSGSIRPEGHFTRRRSLLGLPHLL